MRSHSYDCLYKLKKITGFETTLSRWFSLKLLLVNSAIGGKCHAQVDLSKELSVTKRLRRNKSSAST